MTRLDGDKGRSDSNFTHKEGPLEKCFLLLNGKWSHFYNNSWYLLACVVLVNIFRICRIYLTLQFCTFYLFSNSKVVHVTFSLPPSLLTSPYNYTYCNFSGECSEDQFLSVVWWPYQAWYTWGRGEDKGNLHTLWENHLSEPKNGRTD